MEVNEVHTGCDLPVEARLANGKWMRIFFLRVLHIWIGFLGGKEAEDEEKENSHQKGVTFP